jgi:hypothetical protein
MLSNIDLAKWAPRIIKKYEFDRGVGRTNEAAGIIMVSPDLAQNNALF